MIKLFISHSAADAELAGALADLFRSALRISAADIRCTSVDGYRLPGGANTDEQLRQEVLQAPVFVGIVSHASFDSAYVLFELGARWGRNEYLVPLLASGVPASILKGPISGLNALSCDRTSQLHQLVAEVGQQLDLTPEPAAVYQSAIEVIAERQESAPAIPRSSAERDPEFGEADSIIKAKCESEWSDDYEMRLHCEESQRQALAKLQRRDHEGVPDEVFEQIRATAAREWPDDFEMRLHTEEGQLAAYRKLHT